MLKMIIRMDDDKINIEKKYRLEGIYRIIDNALKKQPWFMDNVAVWLLCDSDDSDSPDDFNEEDLLRHYRQKQTMGT